jgi:hypothetical protein
MANTQAYYDTATIIAVKSFLVQALNVLPKWRHRPKIKTFLNGRRERKR